jgi:hypothetical protein
MIIQIMTMFVVPVFQSIWREGKVKKQDGLLRDNSIGTI